MGNAIVKLVKKVKKLEGLLKRRNLVLTDSEDEEPEVQGRKSQADPQDSSKQGLVTPPTTKAHASGEEQEEEISPNTLEAAKLISKVVSLKSLSIDKEGGTKEEKKSTGKKVISSLDISRDKILAEKINTAVKLSFEEVKEEFDKLIKQIDSFAPISFEATKDSLKRFGEELQTKTPKRLKEDKDDEAKDDEPTKKLTKRRKQIARKGMHTSMDENVSDDSDKVDEQEETNTVVLDSYGIDMVGWPDDKLE
ncbi:hypothetical protein Tco_0666423 [Tanacetum coccineum]